MTRAIAEMNATASVYGELRRGSATGERAVSWTEVDARHAMHRAGVSDAHEIPLSRMGENAVFVDVPSGVVFRVARPTTSAAVVAASFHTNEVLRAAGAPVMSPRRDITAMPITTSSGVVAAWQYYPVLAGDAAKGVGEAINDLHRSTVPDGLLQPFDPLGWASRLLEVLPAAGVPDAARAALRARFEVVTRQPLRPEKCPIHGDAHTGNVRAHEDDPVLIDTDELSLGPWQWDFVPTYVASRRFENRGRDFDRLAESYGADPTAWDQWVVAVQTYELIMVAWLAQQWASSDGAAEEAAHRIDTLSEEESGGWNPF